MFDDFCAVALLEIHSLLVDIFDADQSVDRSVMRKRLSQFLEAYPNQTGDRHGQLTGGSVMKSKLNDMSRRTLLRVAAAAGAVPVLALGVQPPPQKWRRPLSPIRNRRVATSIAAVAKCSRRLPAANRLTAQLARMAFANSGSRRPDHSHFLTLGALAASGVRLSAIYLGGLSPWLRLLNI